MTTFLAAFAVVAAVMAAMALGVVLGGRPLRGSCGGPGSEGCTCTSAAERAACDRAPRADRAA